MKVWVLVRQDDDPFVAGGVPRQAYDDEQQAWDALAEFAAWDASDWWESRLRRYGQYSRVTRYEAVQSAAAAYSIWLVRLNYRRRVHIQHYDLAGNPISSKEAMSGLTG
jgi:hypothetical protein